jgi:hypothetical protein
MKSIILASILLLFAESSSAQKKETAKTQKVKTTFYVGFGVQSTSNFNINSKLAAAALPQIKRNVPEFTVGLNMVGPKYSSDIEASTAFSNEEVNNAKNAYVNSSARIRLQRNLVKKTNILFTAGANLAFTSSSLNVFANNNLIDLNNLTNSINVNHLGLRNNMLYLGPSVSFTTFQKARFPIRLNVGYEFALTRGRWQSDVATIDNTVGEFGKNRIIVSLNLM